MTPDPQLIQATRAAFEDLLDESPLAPDWERVTGQVVLVPSRPSKRRPRLTYPLATGAVAAVVLVGATLILYSGRWGTVQEGDSIAPGIQANVCDLFTEEEVTAIVRDAYLTNGVPAAAVPTLLSENPYGPDGRGSTDTDSCDWHAWGEGAAWVILERIQDEAHEPHWSPDGFYQATPPIESSNPMKQCHPAWRWTMSSCGEPMEPRPGSWGLMSRWSMTPRNGGVSTCGQSKTASPKTWPSKSSVKCLKPSKTTRRNGYG